jgi:hypothetical protein
MPPTRRLSILLCLLGLAMYVKSQRNGPPPPPRPGETPTAFDAVAAELCCVVSVPEEVTMHPGESYFFFPSFRLSVAWECHGAMLLGELCSSDEMAFHCHRRRHVGRRTNNRWARVMG